MSENQRKLLEAWIKYFPEKWSVIRQCVFPAGDDVCETIYWFDDFAAMLKEWDKL